MKGTLSKSRALAWSAFVLAGTVASCGSQGTTNPAGGADASSQDAVPLDSSHADSSIDSSLAEAAAGEAQSDAMSTTETGSEPDAAACGGCPAGRICCNVLMGGTYQCIDPLTDPLDCGGCNVICRPGSQYCGNGTCATPPCSTSTCTSGLCCGAECCAHGRICCATDGGLQCVGGITCP